MNNNKNIDNNSICLFLCIGILFILLLFFMFTQCYYKENFTAPGLTLTIPPSWFPQNSAKKYRMDDWKVKAYLDRYPFYDAKTKKYLGFQESQDLASTNRFWIN